MNLQEKLANLYPELQDHNFSIGNIILVDDGKGFYIAKWEHPTLAKPTDEELGLTQDEVKALVG
jgi:hypothetical protein